MVRLVISCPGYLVTYPKTRHVVVRSKTSTAIYLCYSAFRAALGSAGLTLPRLEFMRLTKQRFAVQTRSLWELRDLPRVLFCWAVCEHVSTLSNSREIYSSTHDDAKSALGGCCCRLRYAVGFMCVGTQSSPGHLTRWKRHQRATKKTNWGTAEPRQADIPHLPGGSAPANAFFFIYICRKFFYFLCCHPMPFGHRRFSAAPPRAAGSEPGLRDRAGEQAGPGQAGHPRHPSRRRGAPAPPHRGRGEPAEAAPGGGRGEAGAPGRPPGPLPGCI